MNQKEKIVIQPFRSSQKRKLVRTIHSVPQTHVLFVGPTEGASHHCHRINSNNTLSMLLIPDAEIALGNTEKLIMEAVKELFYSSRGDLRAIMLYTGCQTRFLGVDFNRIVKTIENELPLRVAHYEESQFANEDEFKHQGRSMAECVFDLLPISDKESDRTVLLLSGFSEFSNKNELYQYLKHGAYELIVSGAWGDFDDFLKCGQAHLQLVTDRVMLPIAESLYQHHQIPYLYLPISYRLSEIENGYIKLDEALDRKTQISNYIAETNRNIDLALEKAQDRNIDLNLSGVSQPWNLTRSLLEYGFCVSSVTVPHDESEEDKRVTNIDCEWMKETYPNIQIIKDKKRKGRRLSDGKSGNSFSRQENIEEKHLWGFALLNQLMQIICEAVD